MNGRDTESYGMQLSKSEENCETTRIQIKAENVMSYLIK